MNPAVEYYPRDDICYRNSILESVFVEMEKDEVDKDRILLLVLFTNRLILILTFLIDICRRYLTR